MAQNSNAWVVSPVPMGEYDNTKIYQKLNIVTYTNGTYICRQKCVGITPSVTANWQNYWMLCMNLTLSNTQGTSQSIGYTQEYINNAIAEAVAHCTTTPTTTSTASATRPAVIVENYLSSDGLTWYRVWSDGYMEIKMRISVYLSISSSYNWNTNVNLPKSFGNRQYFIVTNTDVTGNGAYAVTLYDSYINVANRYKGEDTRFANTKTFDLFLVGYRS